MIALELLRSIGGDLLRHKLRTFLAMFGIIWGTLTVVLLLALGEGFYRANLNNFSRLIDGAIIVAGGVTSKPYQGYEVGRPIEISYQTALDLKKVVLGIKYITPTVVSQSIIVAGTTQIDARVMGTFPDYFKITKREALPGGRYINQMDLRQVLRVAFLSESAKEKLFPNQNAVGKQILISGLPFTVIGVQAEPANTGWHQNMVTIPYTTSRVLLGDAPLTNVFIAGTPERDPESLVHDVTRVLSHRYHFAYEDNQALLVTNPQKTVQFFTAFFRGIQIFLGICGSLTLAVGGLSVANLMYLIVSERTPEIGLRMSLGARTYHILLQILSEAMLIVSIASVIGITIAYVITAALTKIGMPDWLGAPVISGTVVFATFLVLMLVAIFAGLMPARRAARLHPVEALAF